MDLTLQILIINLIECDAYGAAKKLLAHFKWYSIVTNIAIANPKAINSWFFRS